MKITLPALKAHMGGRDYYACVVQLGEIPRICTFRDWSELKPEDRLQRTLNKGRIGPIKRYILEHEEGYQFSSLVANFKGEEKFVPIVPGSDCGYLEVEGDAQFLLADGQHRAEGIKAALQESPDLASDNITLLLYKYESLERAQQMFSDLNRYAVKTSKSLNMLYDHNDQLARVSLAACEQVDIFKTLVDKEKTVLPKKSTFLFTLSALYYANEEFLAPQMSPESAMLPPEQIKRVAEFWNYITSLISEWQDVKQSKKTAMELRQHTISTHAIMLSAIGHIGGQVKVLFPKDWPEKLAPLAKFDFSRENPVFKDTLIVSNSVISNRQSRDVAKAILWQYLGLPKPAMAEKPPVPPKVGRGRPKKDAIAEEKTKTRAVGSVAGFTDVQQLIAKEVAKAIQSRKLGRARGRGKAA